jgi:virginiamycin B lyase
MRLLRRAPALGALALLYASSAWSQGFVLPAGEGKALVERHCMRCHDAQKLAGPDGGHWPQFGPGKSADEWQRVMGFMGTYGLTLSREEVPIVTAYLTKALAGPARPAGVRVAGPVEATIREWKVTPGTRPHDPAVAPDGSVWYTGQAGSRLGRLDPRTGEVKNFPLRPDNTKLPYGVGPHGLVADKDGNIWYTGQQDGHVGKLDPKTGAVTKYKMPNPAAGGPHTPIFDQKGTLWFTMQQGNMVGRLVPSSGEIRLVTVTTPASEPYGLVINSKGVPFFTQLMGNRIGSIDPATLRVREYFLGAGTGPRRLAVTPDDIIYYTDYARGKLGRLDPATGQTKEWDSPSGARSQPYAITAAGRIVWYVEGNANPNMLVRFDPSTERFQTWPILPSGGGVVRHMVVAPDGSLWLAGSEVDAMAKVEIKGATTTK